MAVELQPEINVTGAIPAGLSWSLSANRRLDERYPMGRSVLAVNIPKQRFDR